MTTRRKYKLRPFIIATRNKDPNFNISDLRNYITYGDQYHPVLSQYIIGAPQRMLNIRSLTGSIPLDVYGCWDDVFEYVIGDPQGVGWERFGVGYFDPDQEFGAARGYQGAIYIPPGTYPIRRRTLDFSGKHIFGLGGLHGFNATTIEIHSSASASFSEVAYCSVNASTVQGITFNANHKAKYGFRATKQSNTVCYFDNIRGLNAKSHGVYFDRCQGTTFRRIAGSTSPSVGSGSGVVFSGCNASRATQIESTSGYNHWGVQVLGGTHMVNYEAGFGGGMYLSSIRVENALSGGVLAAGLGPTAIQDGWIESVYGHGIKSVDCIGATIERCRITAVNVTSSLVPEGQSRAVYHSGAIGCTVRNCGIEAPPGGALESEKFERTAASEVTYSENYNLYGTTGFDTIVIISSSV